MYVVLAEFLVAPERAASFQEKVLENARASKEREPGCHVFDVAVAVAVADPTKILLYELYDDRAAFDVHLKSSRFLAFDGAVKTWILDKKVRTFQLLDSGAARP